MDRLTLSVSDEGGRIFEVYPDTQMVEPMLSCVTVSSTVPGVQAGSGRYVAGVVPFMWQCMPEIGAPTVPGASRVRIKGDGAPWAAVLVELPELPELLEPCVPDLSWLVQLVHQSIAATAEAIDSQPRIDVFIDSITAVTRVCLDQYWYFSLEHAVFVRIGRFMMDADR